MVKPIAFEKLWDRISVETSRQRAMGLGLVFFALAGGQNHNAALRIKGSPQRDGKNHDDRIHFKKQ